MIVYLILLIIVLVWNAKVLVWNENYCERNHTTSIKGFFIILVLFSHANSYLPKIQSILNTPFYFIIDHIGQLMVVMFFFYSGYGIMESYKNKNGYRVSFLKNRVLKTYLHFLLALPAYIILNVIYKNNYSLNNYLLSFIGWTSIGNSNWYIFDIIVLYILTYIAFVINDKRKYNNRVFCIIVTMFTIVMWIFLKLSGKGQYWYNTILAFPLGMIISIYKHEIEEYSKNKVYYYSSIFVIFSAFVSLYLIKNDISFSIRSCLFALLVVICSFRVQIGNAVLFWCGNHLFAIYILQRLPMIILSRIKIPNVIFLILVILITLLLAALFTTITNSLDKKFFPGNKSKSVSVCTNK